MGPNCHLFSTTHPKTILTIELTITMTVEYPLSGAAPLGVY